MKKKEREAAVADQNKELVAKVKHLESQVSALQEENTWLKELIEQRHGGGGSSAAAAAAAFVSFSPTLLPMFFFFFWAHSWNSKSSEAPKEARTRRRYSIRFSRGCRQPLVRATEDRFLGERVRREAQWSFLFFF